MASENQERIRSFIAIEVDDDIRRALADSVAHLRACGADVRWVREQGLHVTLKFLGDVPTATIDRIRDALSQILDSFISFPATIRGLGGFPSLARARVLWAGVVAEPVAALAAAIDRALAPLGFAPADQPFHPHITLGRVRGNQNWKNLLDHARPYLEAEFGRCTINSVVLFRSTLRRDGSIYTPLWTGRFGADASASAATADVGDELGSEQAPNRN